MEPFYISLSTKLQSEETEELTIPIDDNFIIFNLFAKYAVSNNKLAIIQEFINRGLDVHINDDVLLQLSCEQNHINMVKLLLENYKYISKTFEKYLVDAIKNQNINIFETFIEPYFKILKVNNLDIDRTILLSIVNTANILMVKTLCNSVNFQNHNTALILKVCTVNGYMDIFEYIINKYNNISIDNDLMITATTKRHTKIIKLLVDYGCSSIDMIKDSLILASKLNYIDIIMYLLMLNLDNNIKDEAILMAAENGNKDIVALLIVNNNNITKNKNEAFTRAIIGEHKDIVDILLKADCVDINTNNNFVIKHVIKCGYTEIYSILVDSSLPRGCVNIHDIGGEALILACENDQSSMVKLLLNASIKATSSAFVIALSKNNFDIMKLLINTEIIDDINDTALTIAIESGNFQTIKLLIELGFTINTKIFMPVIVSNNIDIINFLLDIIPNSNISNEVLLLAITNSNIDVINLLIDRDILIDNAALLCAITHNKVEIVNLFLDKGLKIDDSLVTLVMQNNDTKIIKIFIDRGLEITKDLINLAIKYNRIEIFTIFLNKYIVISKQFIITAIKNNNIDIIKLLINRGAKVNNEIIILAIQNLNIIKLFIEKGIDIKQTLLFGAENGLVDVVEKLVTFIDDNITKEKALELATKNKHEDIIKILNKSTRKDEPLTLEKAIKLGKLEMVDSLLKSDAELLIDNVDNILILTLKNDNISIFELLIKNYVKIDILNIEKLLKLAMDHKKSSELINLILDNGPKNKALIFAAKNNNLDMVKIIIDKGITLGDKKSTAFIEAAAVGSLAILHLLLDNTLYNLADMSLALVPASKNGHIAVVRLIISTLLANHVHFNIESTKALILAAMNGHTGIVKLLLEKGADIHDTYDKALRQASKNGHTATVKLLLDKGANIHMRNDEALRYAVAGEHKETEKLLVSRGAIYT